MPLHAMSIPPKSIVGVVVSAGKMQRAVKVRVSGQVFNSFLRKVYMILMDWKTNFEESTND